MNTDIVPPTQHPLGPLVWRTLPESASKTRLIALAIMVVSSTILIAAWSLSPDPSGLGTHTQLGLAPCSMIGISGYPCPTCGMTTAFAHTVRGQLAQAFLTQPTGLVFALCTIAACLISTVALVSGRAWRLNWYRVTPAKLGGYAIAVFLFGWAYKVVSGIINGSLPAF